MQQQQIPPLESPLAVVRRIADSNGVIVVEAPPGYRKSQLYAALNNLANSMSFEAGDIAGIWAQGVMGIVGIGRVDDEVDLHSIRDLAAGFGLVVIVGRCVLFTEDVPEPVLSFGPADLSLTETETLGLTAQIEQIDDALAQAIHTFTRGVPALTEAAIAAVSVDGLPPSAALERLQSSPNVGFMIDRCLGELDAEEIRIFGQLSHLERFSPQIASVLLAGHGFRDAKAKGLPLLPVGGGWYEIAEPVRSVLRERYELLDETARSIASMLVSEAGVTEAGRLLVSAGRSEVAAGILCDIPPHRLDDANQAELASLLRTLLDLEKDDGNLRLRLARVYHNRGELASQRRTLEKASATATEQLRPDLAVEAQAELLMLDLATLPPNQSTSRLAALVEESEVHSSAFARIRLREIEAMLSAHVGDLASIYRSIGLFEDVSNDWEIVGEHGRSSATLRMLTASSLLHLGKYNAGIDAMRRACSLVPTQRQSLAKSLELRARMTALAGDAEEFARVSQVAAQHLRGTKLSWAEGYLAWSAMIIAGFVNDADAVRRHHNEARVLLGDLLEHATGTVFHADTAVAHAMVRDRTGATAALERARMRVEDAELEVALAAIVVAARVGDPSEVAALIAETRRSMEIPVERDWRLDIEQLSADWRRSAEIDAGRIDEILDEARRHDLELLGRKLVTTASLPDPTTFRTEICVLGDFSIHVDGAAVSLPPGKVTDLVKLLAVRGGPVPVDVVIDELWPGVAGDVGRRRLKNVVNRCRSQLEDTAVTRSGASLSIGGSARVDLTEFRSFLVTSGDEVEYSPDRAIRAVNFYRGPLLAADLYADWMVPERQAARTQATTALDAALRSPLVTPAWALEALRRINPPSEELYVRVGELAVDHGDAVTARECVRRALDICCDLGVDGPARLRQLQSRLEL